MHARQRVGAQAQFACHQLGRHGDCGDVRLLTQVAGVEAEQQVRHGRVAGHGDLVDLVELDPVALLQLHQQLVDGLHGETLQASQAARALGVDDA